MSLALGLPPETEFHEEIVIAAFGVMAFPIFVQGLMMTALSRRLQIVPCPAIENINSQELDDRSQEPPF